MRSSSPGTWTWGYGWIGLDFGGPHVPGRDPVLRLGTDATPFVILLETGKADDPGALVPFDDDVPSRPVAGFPAGQEGGAGSAPLRG